MDESEVARARVELDEETWRALNRGGISAPEALLRRKEQRGVVGETELELARLDAGHDGGTALAALEGELDALVLEALDRDRLDDRPAPIFRRQGQGTTPLAHRRASLSE